MCTAFRTSDDHWPEQLAAVIRTFLSPGCFRGCVKVGGVTVESTRSSWKSYQCQVLGSFVLWSVSVTCWPAEGCICSGNPVRGPGGPQVEAAPGGPACRAAGGHLEGPGGGVGVRAGAGAERAWVAHAALLPVAVGEGDRIPAGRERRRERERDLLPDHRARR